MKAMIQAMVILVVLYLLFQASAILINVTFTQILDASNSTGVAGQTTPILNGLGNVFQIIAGVFGIGIFVILFAIVLGGKRDEPIQPY